MKSSKHNMFFPSEDKMIGYNTITDNYIVLEPIFYELLQASIQENMLNELQNVHSNFYDTLVKNGFIITDEVNEEKMQSENGEKNIDQVKEKYSKRIDEIRPSDHLNKTINRLLEVDLRELSQFEDSVFQKKLHLFLDNEVRAEYRDPMEEINQLYIEILLGLRKNNMRIYEENDKKITKKLAKLDLNENEGKIFFLFTKPIISYFHYKKENYLESIKCTNESILSDDLFLEKYPFLYGHKIQQIHNIIRIYFKINEIDKATDLCNKVLGHLVEGNELNYEIGYWYSDFDINQYGEELVVMIYQIFSETIMMITNLSSTVEEEKNLYKKAFSNIENFVNTSEELKLIKSFFEIKYDLIYNDNYNEEKLNKWIDNAFNSKWGSFTAFLFYSLFSTLGIKSIKENKEEFKRVHSWIK